MLLIILLSLSLTLSLTFSLSLSDLGKTEDEETRGKRTKRREKRKRSLHKINQMKPIPQMMRNKTVREKRKWNKEEEEVNNKKVRKIHLQIFILPDLYV